jgi:hypothetical protein
MPGFLFKICGFRHSTTSNGGKYQRIYSKKARREYLNAEAVKVWVFILLLD